MAQSQDGEKLEISGSDVSRRDLVRKGAGAIASGAAAIAASGVALAQQAPTAAKPGLAGRVMRAFVRTSSGSSVQNVKLLALRDDMVAIRTEATQCCYTIVNQALGSGQVGAGGA